MKDELRYPLDLIKAELEDEMIDYTGMYPWELVYPVWAYPIHILY